MRWPVFGLFVYLAMALEQGLGNLFEIKRVNPSFLLIVGAFIAVSAPPKVVIWSSLILGLLSDLLHPLQLQLSGLADVTIIGPSCIGYLVGGYVAIQLRGLMFRDSPTTIGLMVIAMGAFVHLIIVAALTVRGLPFMLGDPVIGWYAPDQLLRRFFILMYTAVLALPIGFALLRTDSLWGFPSVMGYRRLRRT